MNEFLPAFLSYIAPKESVRFKCVGCGNCCRHVRNQVVIEPLDVFRMTKLLRDKGEDIYSIADFLERYAEPFVLDKSGYFLYCLKTVGEDDACVFLEDNRCRIHDANPRACRTYPFVAEPPENDTIRYLLSREQPHHFKGPVTNAKSWMKTHLSQEDRAVMKEDFGQALAIHSLMDAVPDHERVRAIMLYTAYHYEWFDLDKPFLPQFIENQTKLKCALKAMGDK